MKLFSIALIICIVFICLFILYSYNNSEEEEDDDEDPERLYQGPVPKGYDEDHFRKTGETKPLENG